MTAAAQTNAATRRNPRMSQAPRVAGGVTGALDVVGTGVVDTGGVDTGGVIPVTSLIG